MDIYIAKKQKHHKPSQSAKQTNEPTLSSYSKKPKHISFEGQGKNERIILFMRQHPITNIPWMLIAALMLVAPIILSYFPLLEFLPTRFQVIVVVLWYLITLGFILENALGWFFNIYIITNKRIVDIDFYNILHKQISDANLDRIQDITYQTGGVAGTLFRYGNIFIQTAGSSPNFDFDRVSNPRNVVRTIQKLQNHYNGGTKYI